MKQIKNFVEIAQEKESFIEAFDYIKLSRRKNRLKRENEENNKRIRDNQKRVLLLDDLKTYITDNMSITDIRNMIISMRDDYEDRIDDITIQNAEISKERREIKQKMRKMGR